MKTILFSIFVSITAITGCSASHNGAGVDGGGGGGGGGGSDGSNEQGQPTIFTIVLENHDYKEIVGSSNAPYINSLIAMGGLATNYMDSGTHPSLPNYLFLISGATQYPGFIDLSPTTFPFPVNQPNLATQLEAASIKWRAYAEGMGSACNLSDSGEYATKHVPFLYFTDQVNGSPAPCKATTVDYSNFADDLAADTYAYQWITPNLLDDGHDPSTDPVTGLKQSDTWLKNNVPAILASKGFQANGILFITWDEAEGRNGDSADQVPMIILSPRLKMAGMTSSTALSHASYLATVEDLLSLQRLSTVASSPNLMMFLN